MPMPVCPPPNRCPSSGSSAGWLDDLVEQIVAHTEDGLLEQDIAHWREDLRQRLERVQQHPEQGLGFIEEHIRQATLRLQGLLVPKAMQDKANRVEEKCPDCGRPLGHKKRRVVRWIDAYCGRVKLARTHGWCAHCEHWVFPADRALGLRADSTASPLVQEMGALLVSKMPAEQAEALSLRVTGRRLSRSTLGREGQRQGQRAFEVRQKLIEAVVGQPPAAKATAGLGQPPEPFTLVIQFDAWNIRERDFWGQTKKQRRKDPKFDRWHWVYTATCFRLSHRCKKGRFKNKLRAIITERSYVATRGGIEALMKQIYYEARARGLAQAQRVLVLADGAVWIWNLVEDRFKDAIQRLDLWHANSYLWAVANELHGKGSKEARLWVRPLLKQIRNDQVAKVITQ
jgi:hypothetical protein